MKLCAFFFYISDRIDTECSDVIVWGEKYSWNDWKICSSYFHIIFWEALPFSNIQFCNFKIYLTIYWFPILTVGLKPTARARNGRKANVKIRQNPLLRFLSLIQRQFYRWISEMFGKGNSLITTDWGIHLVKTYLRRYKISMWYKLTTKYKVITVATTSKFTRIQVLMLLFDH